VTSLCTQAPHIRREKACRASARVDGVPDLVDLEGQILGASPLERALNRA